MPRACCSASFVTSTPNPRDLDCVIVFEAQIQIPDRSERLAIEGMSLDIFFCAEDQPAILSAFVTLFSETRFMKQAGIVEVPLFGRYGRPLWQIVHQPDDNTLEIVKRIYFQRHIIDRNNSRKALITIHGIRSYGDWNSEVVHVASSNGWIVAPFTYGYVNMSVLANKKEKARIVDEFRKHVDDVYHRYRCDISVIAHSFGTYVAAKYLLGFDEPPVCFDTIILTGSILNEELDIDQFEGRAYRVVNEVAPNDAAVPYAGPGKLLNDLLGQSGARGFKSKSPRLDQRTCDVFTHTNVIRHDVVSQRWMPRLEGNVGKGRREAVAKVMGRWTSAAADEEE
jgi:hypothetical protein